MGLIILNGEQYGSFEETGFPPLIYSDEEREVGVWKDGKPIYKKSYDLGSDTSISYNSWTEVNANYPAGCGLIIHVDCTTSGGTYASGISVEKRSNGKFGMQTCRNGNDQSVRYFTILYTKTTDVPGGGKYTTYGGIAHHYSYNEQIIGTLADGSTLYEKTYVVPCNFTGGEIDIIQLTNEKPIHYEGYAIHSNTGRIYPLPFSNGYATTNFRYNESTNSIRLILANDTWGDYYTFYLTVQYYKSNS